MRWNFSFPSPDEDKESVEPFLLRVLARCQDSESERRTETDHENEKLIKREAEKIGEEGGRVMKESKQLGK